jgi:hypothetical protein
MHEPRFSSGLFGSATELQPLWQTLSDKGVDVVVSAHDSDYERFAPLDANGTKNDQTGMREFVVGTGGKDLAGFGTIQVGSEVHDNSTFGVIKFELNNGSYNWKFIPVAGGTFTDSGTGNCH